MTQPENQNIEYKESWRDEYLKWICGFANAQGGTLYIGKNDSGETVGVQDAQRLIEEIPNKIRDILGIIASVNLHSVESHDYIEIIIEPYPYPVSYKGQYYYRSGSTRQELRGAALDHFLLQKQGRTWDCAPVPHATVDELSLVTFDTFRVLARKSSRLGSDILDETNYGLLQKLHLLEGKYLKRAGVLLFHPDPEKYFTGAYVKIGIFVPMQNYCIMMKSRGIFFHKLKKQ